MAPGSDLFGRWCRSPSVNSRPAVRSNLGTDAYLSRCRNIGALCCGVSSAIRQRARPWAISLLQNDEGIGGDLGRNCRVPVLSPPVYRDDPDLGCISWLD